MRDVSWISLERWLYPCATGISVTASSYVFWLFSGGSILVPWSVSLLCAALVIAALTVTLARGAPVDRFLAVLVAGALLNHLAMTQSPSPWGPTSALEYRSLLRAELGRLSGGLPVRALLSVLGALAWGRCTSLWAGRGRRGQALGILVGLLGVLAILGYATGSLGIWTG